MMTPLIGITCNRDAPENGVHQNNLSQAYVRAVFRAGGLPVLIPVGLPAEQCPALYERLDGLLLSGGGDIAPQRFDGQPHPRINGIDLERDEIEIGLVRLAAENGWPFLGICRGIQVINVALGGGLYTDVAAQLPGALRHDWYPDIPRDYPAHAVTLESGTVLEKILDQRQVQVNSLHHQGVDRAAPGLRANAYAPDGLIEGVELDGHPFGVGVQWHPEWLVDAAPMQALFRAFIQAAQAGKRR
jgi:putative glutamine amidotransferase